jgi:hypothetical protein
MNQPTLQILSCPIVSDRDTIDTITDNMPAQSIAFYQTPNGVVKFTLTDELGRKTTFTI